MPGGIEMIAYAADPTPHQPYEEIVNEPIAPKDVQHTLLPLRATEVIGQESLTSSRASKESLTIQNVLRKLPESAGDRKGVPLMTGCIDYFPLALAAIAEISKAGNDQHNPGQPLHWARGKSTDHADCAMRHLVERGTIDTDGKRHTAKAAWRVLALLQEELEREANWTPKIEV